MIDWHITTNSETETRELGQSVGATLQEGVVIALNGPLGSGKTRLTQAIGRALGIPDGQITSPTFTIGVPHEGRLGLMHLDAYRISDPSEVDELGLDELVEDGVVLAVEWAERIDKFLPEIDISVVIEPVGSEQRSFKFSANTEKGKALLKAAQAELSP